MTARHGEVDLRQDARIEQGTVELATGIVDAVSLAEGIETIALAGVHLAGEC